jgi:hypothetical protein
MVSSYLRQHVEFDAPAVDDDNFRPFWRRRTRLDDLVADKSIGPREYLAAIAYRDLVERVGASAWGALRTETIDRATAGAEITGRASADRRLTAIRAKLGAFAARLVDLVVVVDMPWAELGRRYRVDPKTIRRWAIETLQLLAGVMAQTTEAPR